MFASPPRLGIPNGGIENGPDIEGGPESILGILERDIGMPVLKIFLAMLALELETTPVGALMKER